MTLRLLVLRALVTGRRYPLKVRVQHGTRARTSKTGKMISTMAQLKNCCLGGDRDRQDKGKEQRILCSPLLSSVSPFLLFNQLGLSIDISWPISFGLVNSFTWIYYFVLVLTDNDSLRTRLLTHVTSTCVHTDKCTFSIQSCRHPIGW